MYKLPVVNLMRRINLDGFSSLRPDAQLEQITKLQSARLEAIAASKQVKTGTKSAARNRSKTPKGQTSIKNDQKKLAALLSQLTPEQIAAIKQRIS